MCVCVYVSVYVSVYVCVCVSLCECSAHLLVDGSIESVILRESVCVSLYV